MKVIIINGSGGVGKDTFIQYAVPYFIINNPNSLVIPYSIIDPIKELMTKIGIKLDKDEKNRKFMSDFKLLMDDYNDLPYRKLIDVFEHAYYHSYVDYNVFIAVMREPKDISRFITELTHVYGFDGKDIYTVLVCNDRVKPITSNIADASVNYIKYDVVIDNNGTYEELRNKAKEFVDYVMLNHTNEEE